MTKTMKKIYSLVFVCLVNGDKSTVRSCGSKTGAKSCYKTAGLNNVRKWFF